MQTSHNKTVETTVASLYYTPQNSSVLVYDRSANNSIDSRGSKGEALFLLFFKTHFVYIYINLRLFFPVVDENICSFYESEKFDCTASTALVDEVCNTNPNKSRVLYDVQCSGDGGSLSLVDKNQTSSDNCEKQTKFCSCPYDRMSEADTEYLDFTPASPLKCSNFDENCFCHHSDDMSSLSMNSSGVNVIKRNYSTNRRMIKIRIKTSSSKECSVEGESTENGIKICISPRKIEENYKSNRNCALNETYSITSSRRISATTSEIGSSSLETDYEFRNNLKNELKRSPAAVKVLNYLESLSEAKKKSPEKILNRKKSKQRSSDPKPTIIETVPLTTAARRSKSKTPQSLNSVVDDDEFHDCCDKTVISSGTGGSSEYEDTTESFDTSQGLENCHDKGSESKKDVPLITITQEMSAQMVVTSKFEINKQKLRRMNEQRERRKSKESRESPDKIIDDNFCNEILDKINQLKDRDGSCPSDTNTDADTIEKVPFDTTTETSTAASNLSLGPQKPPRTFAYRRSQDNTAKTPKQSETRTSLESLDMYLYEEMKQLKLFKFNHSRKSIQIPPKMSPVDASNYVVGGWKVSPNKHIVTTAPAPFKPLTKHNIGWTAPVQSPKKVEPGWVKSSPAPIPADIVNMLHYSDDERKKRSILSSNARAEPQQKYPSSSEK